MICKIFRKLFIYILMDGFLIFCIEQELILLLLNLMVVFRLKLANSLIRFILFEKNVFKSLNNALFWRWSRMLSRHSFKKSFSLLNKIFFILLFLINRWFVCTIESITLIRRVFIGIITITRIAYIIKLLNNSIFKAL